MIPFLLKVSMYLLLGLVSCIIDNPIYAVTADSQWKLVTILHTNDIHGNILPRSGPGGLARAATLINQVRSQLPNVILLDAGDIIHGTSEDYLSRGIASISVMNAIGFQAATTGNHEYDFGLDVLERVASIAQFPLLAANVRSVRGGDWNGIIRCVVLNIDSICIGILGLTTLETVSLHWPGSIKDIVVEDPIATAKQLVPTLRSSVDVLVVLSHLGFDQDRLLAEEVPGIDFIIGGHSHTVVNNWNWVGDTMITQTGAYCRALGRIDFIVHKRNGKAEIWSVNGKRRKWNDLPRKPLGLTYPDGPLLGVDESLPIDESICRVYLPFRKRAESYLSRQIGYAQDDIPGRESKLEESLAAYFMADAVREITKSDIAIVDAMALGSRGLT
ncbi:MAG: bifunctional metallophosphatase/5'-nucleotidase, partial [Armatimonadota bacterium]